MEQPAVKAILDKAEEKQAEQDGHNRRNGSRIAVPQTRAKQREAHRHVGDKAGLTVRARRRHSHNRLSRRAEAAQLRLRRQKFRGWRQFNARGDMFWRIFDVHRLLSFTMSAVSTLQIVSRRDRFLYGS